MFSLIWRLFHFSSSRCASSIIVGKCWRIFLVCDQVPGSPLSPAPASLVECGFELRSRTAGLLDTRIEHEQLSLVGLGRLHIPTMSSTTPFFISVVLHWVLSWANNQAKKLTCGGALFCQTNCAQASWVECSFFSALYSKLVSSSPFFFCIGQHLWSLPSAICAVPWFLWLGAVASVDWRAVICRCNSSSYTCLIVISWFLQWLSSSGNLSARLSSPSQTSCQKDVVVPLTTDTVVNCDHAVRASCLPGAADPSGYRPASQRTSHVLAQLGRQVRPFQFLQ